MLLVAYTVSEQSDWCDNMPISSYNYASVLPVTCPDPIFLPRTQGVHKNFVPGNETNSQAPSLSMHKMKYILTPTTLWCSCQVTMFLIGISNVTRLTMHVVFFRQHSNSCLQWVSWLQLHEYGGLQHLFFSIYLLQQVLELW